MAKIFWHLTCMYEGVDILRKVNKMTDAKENKSSSKEWLKRKAQNAISVKEKVVREGIDRKFVRRRALKII